MGRGEEGGPWVVQCPEQSTAPNSAPAQAAVGRGRVCFSDAQGEGLGHGVFGRGFGRGMQLACGDFTRKEQGILGNLSWFTCSQTQVEARASEQHTQSHRDQG